MPVGHRRRRNGVVGAIHRLTDYRYLLFSARALQFNEAALWLYARVRAPPTSAAEGGQGVDTRAAKTASKNKGKHKKRALCAA